MADAPSFKDWILEAIDQLRKRKARPDLDRICHMLERRHGVGFAQVQQQLETLVQADIVIKVDYKGSTSYRNAAKWIKTVGRNASGQVLDSNDVSTAVGQALRKLKNAGLGVTVRDIEKQLSLDNSPVSRLTRPDTLVLALEQEVGCGRIRKTPSGLYALPEKSPPPPHKRSEQNAEAGKLAAGGATQRDADESSSSSSSPSKGKEKETQKKVKDLDATTSHNNKSKEVEEKEQTPCRTSKRPASPLPIGRPGSRRKRVKKYHGPDFIDSSSLPSPEGLESEDPRCDYCFLLSTANPKGQPEDLLRCTDCNAKAHPSCMEYSPELAKKSRLGPWQCMDCKACSVCQGSVNGDCMLFCDHCDKGYHMRCHQPKVTEKPAGKWLCSKCSPETKAAPAAPVPKPETTPTVPTRGRPRRGVKPSPVSLEMNSATAGLPTPCDSPVSDFDSSPECDEKSNKPLIGEGEMDKYPENIPDAKDWTIHDVAKFFTILGFPEQAPAFKDQEIDGKSLLLMKRSDVLTGLSIRLGPALKIYNHIKRLQTGLPDGHLAVH